MATNGFVYEREVKLAAIKVLEAVAVEARRKAQDLGDDARTALDFLGMAAAEKWYELDPDGTDDEDMMPAGPVRELFSTREFRELIEFIESLNESDRAQMAEQQRETYQKLKEVRALLRCPQNQENRPQDGHDLRAVAERMLPHLQGIARAIRHGPNKAWSFEVPGRFDTYLVTSDEFCWWADDLERVLKPQKP